jgi:hypothetical protein
VTVESGGKSEEDGDIDMNDEGNIIRGHKTKRFYRVNTDKKKDRNWKRYTPNGKPVLKVDSGEEVLSYQ